MKIIKKWWEKFHKLMKSCRIQKVTKKFVGPVKNEGTPDKRYKINK